MEYRFEVGDKVYNLKLTTRGIVGLEKKIGCNPLMIFGTDGTRVPTITEMVAILQFSLNNVSESQSYQIFDNWVQEGHSPLEFLEIILEIFKASGFIKENTDEKN